MKITLFGKEVFEFHRKRSELFFQEGANIARESKYLPDFQGSTGGFIESTLSEYIIAGEPSGGAVAIPVAKKKHDADELVNITLTPKGVYELNLLHDKTFSLNVDPEYVDQQIANFKDKLGIIKSEEYDMRRGVEEIASILVRMENRKKYPEHKEAFEKYAYTTTSKITELTKTHNNLKLGQVAQFIADMPKEATDAMKEYNMATEALCSKKAVFYIIADKKDFKQTEGRRDPILLAQSPFGHVWQILGAWDEEMLLLEDL